MTAADPSSVPPLCAWIALLAAVTIFGCASLRTDAVEARDTANSMRHDVNGVRDELAALAPVMRALCTHPEGGMSEWCGDADKLWRLAQRSIEAAHFAIDAYESGGIAVEGALAAVDAAEDGCGKLIAAIEAARDAVGGFR